ncbi:hypothetical protein CWN95_22925 [Vibrio splendidus]|nr:hypothetical protein A145_05760 [Vibrio splendidus 5S-101]PTP28197.1 hypothetical protein CWN95_22925 [Vibrio splendidus]
MTDLKEFQRNHTTTQPQGIVLYQYLQISHHCKLGVMAVFVDKRLENQIYLRPVMRNNDGLRTRIKNIA